MSSKDKNLSSSAVEALPSIEDFKVGIVVSEWNEDITGKLRDGALETLKKNGCKDDHVLLRYVPGAFELPLGARLLMMEEKLDGIICLGCVIKGETQHDEYINAAVANGIMTLGLSMAKPVIFGVLTPNNHQQAVDRAGGKHGNKGVEAATTLIKMMHLSKESQGPKGGIGFIK